MPDKAAVLFPADKRIHFTEIDSTNTEARRMLNDRPVADLDGTIITADFQSAGKGRVEGRRFFSPAGSGLYMSLIIRPTDCLITPDLITPAAGVAVCRTIEQLTGKHPQIKWVNDVYLEGKKVCGILTEGTLSPDGKIDALIVGIGVNLREAKGGFPEELRDVAGALLNADELYDKKTCPLSNAEAAGDQLSESIGAGRVVLTTDSFLSELLVQIETAFNAAFTDETISEYQQRSLVVGRRVTVLAGNETYLADVLEVTKKCHLIVRPVESSLLNERQGDGYSANVFSAEGDEAASSETRELLSGEVSLRLTE